MFRWSSFVLNPQPASDIIHFEESGAMSLGDSVWPVEQDSIIYKHQLFPLCSTEKRAAGIIYYRLSIPSGINLDCWSMHPAITKMEKNNSSVTGNLNLRPCPWNLNSVIDCHTSNLRQHSWAKNQATDFEIHLNLCIFPKHFFSFCCFLPHLICAVKM